MKRLLTICVLCFIFLSTVVGATFVREDVLDDFGDPTGEFRVVTEKKLSGTYKSPSTSNGKCNYSVILTPDSNAVTFVIEENGKDQDLSTAWWTDETYTVKVKDDAGNTISYTGRLQIGPGYKSNAIEVGAYAVDGYFKYITTLQDVMLTNKSIKVVISNDRGSYSLGTINTSDVLGLYYDKTLYSEAESLYQKGQYEDAKGKILEMEQDNLESFVFYNGNKLKEDIFSALGEYCLGIKGPAGGYIFYDCDADNESGNADGLISTSCGWRYLEAAPVDITVDSKSRFIFGHYRTDSSFERLYVNGTTTYNESDCTGTAIGTGKSNTQKLVAAIGSNAYTSDFGTEITDRYAAKLCEDYIYGGYDDWFLPSKDELNMMYVNLNEKGLGSFVKGDYWYWSSSESNYICSAWAQRFYNGYQSNYYGYRSDDNYVRAVRAF